jgi:hypothetical protein
MKYLAALALFALGANLAQAESSTFINGDGSPLTDLCIAALDSEASFEELTAAHDLQGLTESDLVCNGLSLSLFKARYIESVQINTVLAFSKADLNPATELCFAAVTNAQELESLKDSYEGRTNTPLSSVTCNGIPLNRFVRRYGAHVSASAN